MQLQLKNKNNMIYLPHILNYIDQDMAHWFGCNVKAPAVPKGTRKHMISTIATGTIPDINSLNKSVQKYYCLIFYPIYKVFSDSMKNDMEAHIAAMKNMRTKGILEYMLFELCCKYINKAEFKDLEEKVASYFEHNNVYEKRKIYIERQIEDVKNRGFNHVLSCKLLEDVLKDEKTVCRKYYIEEYLRSQHPNSKQISIINIKTKEVLTFKSKYELKKHFKIDINNNDALQRFLDGKSRKFPDWRGYIATNV